MQGARNLRQRQSQINRLQGRIRIRELNRQLLRDRQNNLASFEEMVWAQKSSLDLSPQQNKSSYQTIIDAYRGMTFNLIDLPAYISSLASGNLFQKHKSVIAIAKLSPQLREQYVRDQALANGIIPRLIQMMRDETSSFLQSQGIGIFIMLVRFMKSEEYLRHINNQTVPIQCLGSLLKSSSTIVADSSLALMEELFLNGYQLSLLQDKRQFLLALSSRISSNGRISQSQSVTILNFVAKIELVTFKEADSLLQITCQILKKMLDSTSYLRCRNQIKAQVESILTRTQFIRSIDLLLEHYPTKIFIHKYQLLCKILYRVMKSERKVNNLPIFFFESKFLLKYLKSAKAIDLIRSIGILDEVEVLLLHETKQRHSSGWEIAISCLAVVERLFFKNHTETRKRYEENAPLMFKLAELYSVQQEPLSQQLNKTVAKMISSSNSTVLLNLLVTHGIISSFLQPSFASKNQQAEALFTMKNIYQKLQQRGRKGEIGAVLALRRGICESNIEQRIRLLGEEQTRSSLINFYGKLIKQHSIHKERL